MPALIGYYAMHDLENGRIGIAPHKDSDKPRLLIGDDEKPVKQLDGNLNNVKKEVLKEEIIDMSEKEKEATTWSFITVSIIFFILLAIGYFGIYKTMDNDTSIESWVKWLVFLSYLALMIFICFWPLQWVFYDVIMDENSLDDSTSGTAVESEPTNSGKAPVNVQALFSGILNQLFF